MMKKMYSSPVAKAIAIILWVAAVMGLVASLIGGVVIAGGSSDIDLYESDEQAIRENLYDHAAANYSVWALSEYGYSDSNVNVPLDGSENVSFIDASPNVNYGIVKGRVSDVKALKDGDFIRKNFDLAKTPIPSDARINEMTWGDTTGFNRSTRLITGSYYYTGAASYSSGVHPIRGIGYDVIDSRLYLYDGEHFYPVDDGQIEWFGSEQAEDGYGAGYALGLNEVYRTIWELNREAATDASTLYMGGTGYSPLSDRYPDQCLYIFPLDNSLSPHYIADISSLHEELRTETGDWTPVTEIYQGDFEAEDYEYNKEHASIDYSVIVFPNEPLDMSAGFFGGDLFVQAVILTDVLCRIRYVVPILAIVSFILALMTFIFLMIAAGRRADTDEIKKHALDNIPLDLSFVLSFMITVIPVGIVGAVISSMGTFFSYEKSAVFYIVIGVMITTLIALIVIWWFMSFAVNLKCGYWWRNTVIYRLLMLLAKPCKAVMAFIKKICIAIKRDSVEVIASIHATVRIWICFAIFGIVNCLWVLSTLNSGMDVFALLFPEYILLGVGLFFLLKHTAKLKTAAAKIAGGDYEAKVDTAHMPLDLADHGRNLNSIGDGINTAINEKIKSERFKTELITNVSHDIKTPLTSIINYVDLLGKEDLENAQAKEYIEVLNRQSERLKKLIEDLIEASKASTGNLKLEMSEADVGVLLTQMSGEYEERFEKAGVTMVCEMPDHPVMLKADHRYLWRVFDNLMGNIAKYSQNGTRAYVTLKDETDSEGKTHVNVTFKNTSRDALNITEDELMQRFVRGDRSRSTDGSGLGLSIAESLTTMMGGSFNIAIDGDLFKAIVRF